MPNILYQGRKVSIDRKALWILLGWFFHFTLKWHHPFFHLPKLFVYAIVWWHYGTASYWYCWLPKGTSVTVKQRSMFLNICTFKLKINSKHFKSSRMAPTHPKWQMLFTQRFIHYKTFTLWEKKTAQNDYIKPDFYHGVL